ncbi:MAG: 1-deoxy-D-xylulose-5-phosphate reductoisomerase [Rhodospirillaceae bacterium]|nr:1-deoxy-D-xylulose-5-phosphate reductoisomerase [Rhodospirillaceae bacterium]|tara:strand:+ start:5020 stop:6195 length:1176 start_codon:yes stop_codon:yes gene_type:complete
MADTCTSRTVSILGATGSVGESTLDLVRRGNGAFAVEAVTANTRVGALAKLAREVGARFAAIGDPDLYDDLKSALSGTGIECGAGESALDEAAERPAEWVMAAIVGAAGLSPTLRAVRRGAIVALANKETLVCAGDIFMEEVRRFNSTVLPVDSEHNAIHQVFEFDRIEAVEKLILTASGGPFLEASMEVMRAATPEQAVAHPNWNMGAKISVDSATMMNKGLELIEAGHLFPVGEDKIDVVVHPESIIHSMVAYCDGSVLAQLGAPDMRTPIAYTLAWPSRMAGPSPRLDLIQIGNLSFYQTDLERFPALRVARDCIKSGGQAPLVMNGANEVAVQGFLDGAIGFLDIVAVVEESLDAMGSGTVDCLADVADIDRETRQFAETFVAARAR